MLWSGTWRSGSTTLLQSTLKSCNFYFMLQHSNGIIIFSAPSTLQTSTTTPPYKPNVTYTPTPTATPIPTVFNMQPTSPTVSTYSTESETVLLLLIFLTFYASMSTMFLFFCLGFSCCKVNVNVQSLVNLIYPCLILLQILHHYIVRVTY